MFVIHVQYFRIKVKELFKIKQWMKTQRLHPLFMLTLICQFMSQLPLLEDLEELLLEDDLLEDDLDGDTLLDLLEDDLDGDTLLDLLEDDLDGVQLLELLLLDGYTLLDLLEEDLDGVTLLELLLLDGVTLLDLLEEFLVLISPLFVFLCLQIEDLSVEVLGDVDVLVVPLVASVLEEFLL